MSDMQYTQIVQLQDQLTGSLIGLARATDGNEHLISDASTSVIVDGLAATIPQADVDIRVLEQLLNRVDQEKRNMVPNCFTCAMPCGRTNAYDMASLRNAPEDIRSLKHLILLGLRSTAAYAHHAAALGQHDKIVDRFFYKALNALGMDHWTEEGLLPILVELGKVNQACMALLNSANGM